MNWTPNGSAVKVEQAIGDPRYGSQNTDGSQSIRGFYAMRCGNREPRRAPMFIQAAAQQWGVPAPSARPICMSWCILSSGRKLGYGELATAASKLPVPPKEDLQFKSKNAWRYIGKGMPSVDLAELCTGKAVFGMDARMDGMVYASIAASAGAGRKGQIL